MAVELFARNHLLALCLACTALAAATAKADENDPPSRIARIAYISGSVSLQPAGTQDWVAAPLNRPLSTGDTLWAADDGRTELQLDGSALRLTNSSELGIVNLNNDVTQVQLSSGTLILRVRRLDGNETYEVDTPNLAFSVLRAGVYRISVDPAGNTTSILVHDGEGEATGAGAAYTVEPGSYDVFSGTDQLTAESEPTQPPDEFDAWSAERDGRWEHARSVQYVSPDVIGYEDLDDHGDWQTSADYGPVWYPREVAPGWAPYQAGHWAYIAPWGYTWVDDQPWGFAPFHYGRWIWGGGRWGWIPARPRPPQGEGWVRPVYAPALVAWVGAGAGVAWFALGPREVYVPSYPVSQNYVRNINVSNTTINKTVINNVYNTTIINNKTVNVTYINRTAPGAVTATTAAAFTTAQPVARNLVKLDQREIERSSIRAQAPAEVPTKQAVLGSGRPASARPPAAVQARTVVARTAPPPAAIPFERREEAIKNNGGRPLSAQQVHEIVPAAVPARAAPIRRLAAPIAAPVDLAPRGKAGEQNTATAAPQRSQSPVVRSAAPAPMQVSPAAPQAVHARELPPTPKVPSPNVANTAMDREQLQQQQQMRAQQEQERQRIQRQQEAEHQQLAKQQADQAKAQQLEQQRQQQAQQRAQAQQADQAKAQEAERQRQRQEQHAQQQRAQEQQAGQAKAQELERQHQQQTQQLQQQQIQAQQALQTKQQEQRRAPAKPNDPHHPAP